MFVYSYFLILSKLQFRDIFCCSFVQWEENDQSFYF